MYQTDSVLNRSGRSLPIKIWRNTDFASLSLLMENLIINVLNMEMLSIKELIDRGNELKTVFDSNSWKAHKENKICSNFEWRKWKMFCTFGHNYFLHLCSVSLRVCAIDDNEPFSRETVVRWVCTGSAYTVQVTLVCTSSLSRIVQNSKVA